MSQAKTALLLIAHGSRQPEANADLHYLVGALRRRGGYDIVEGAFLELTAPDIEAGGAECVAQGATLVLMLPYFLSAGIHVKEDLSDVRQKLADRFPGVEFRLGEPLGRHPLLLLIVAERAAELAAAVDRSRSPTTSTADEPPLARMVMRHPLPTSAVLFGAVYALVSGLDFVITSLPRTAFPSVKLLALALWFVVWAVVHSWAELRWMTVHGKSFNVPRLVWRRSLSTRGQSPNPAREPGE